MGFPDAALDLRAVRVFLEVALTRSMTLAAVKLNLTQSAVSQSIQKLETDLGVKLVEKGKRPIALTRAGDLLESCAGPLLHEAARLPHRLAEAMRDAPQELRIGMIETFAATAGPELARELMQVSRRMVMWAGLNPSLIGALLDREVDVIVSSDPLDDVDGLERFVLWKEPFVFLRPASRPPLGAWANLPLLSANLPFIRYTARSQTGREVERHLRRLNLAIERRVEVDGSDALVRLVAAGAGWGICTPLCLLQARASADGIAVERTPTPQFSRTLYLLCRSDGPIQLAAKIAGSAVEVLRRVCLPQLDALQPAAITASIRVGPDKD